ncbi:MAG: hypothetical protein V4554_04370 [Pseudomonadota bacterium]
MKRLLAMLSFLLISMGCGGQGTIPMQGKLIYATSTDLRTFDLDKRQDRRLIEWPHIDTALSVLDKDTLLIDTGYTNPPTIQRLNLKTLVANGLRSGTRPFYMSVHREFFYFYGHLYLADLDKSVQSVHKVAEGSFSYTYVIPVSDDEVVFPIRGDAGKTPPYRYNLVTDKLDQLPFTRQCTPYVWRSVSQQLLCGIDGTSEYYLISLDGRRSAQVDLSGLPSKSPLPLLYIPKYDVLIAGVARMKWLGGHAGEHFDLWAYSFKDGRSEKLLEDNAPGRGGIVWVSQ